MIITKAVTRFARNTLTTLTAVRELTSLGVNVYFENERINSMSGDGELMLSILASYAQEESRSVSENCKWRIRKRFEKGEIVNLRFLLGYTVKKGVMDIDPAQAGIVRMIYADYIGGMGGGAIAKKLREMRVPAPRGGDWAANRVLEIIKNEKYTGNALLQKKYVADHLTKKQVRNTGQLPQYYAEDTHPAIIDMDTFNKAQAILAERGQHVQVNNRGSFPFTGIIRCSGCGKNYKRKITHNKISWHCSTFLSEGKAACHAKQIPESTLLDVTADALGLAEFDPAIFRDKVAEIHVPGFNRLLFVFRDGRQTEVTWADRSRRDSWTDEMKQAARERQLEFMRKGAIE
jgi:DNA invertase Pin-like site-specific DNA recombinase